jgi:hypothetical protein
MVTLSSTVLTKLLCSVSGRGQVRGITSVCRSVSDASVIQRRLCFHVRTRRVDVDAMLADFDCDYITFMLNT